MPSEHALVRVHAVSRRKTFRWAPYLFILPFLLSFLLFFAYPIASSILMSFQHIEPGEETFIGLDNYRKLWNPDFIKAITNNFSYTFWTLLVLIPGPMVLAVLLNAKLTPARNFFRSALFIPALTSVVVAGAIFRLIFGELDGSLMNSVLQLFGLSSQKWLLQQNTAMLAMVLLAAWRWMGINILYYLSALQSIPRDLYESAKIDGAGIWNQFIRITVPMLRPITIYVLTISIYGGFAMFTESYMLWAGKPSPQNIGLTIVGYIYQQGFQYFNLGFGAAIGVALLGITLLLNLIQLAWFGLFRKEE
ncbi:carbohydrate ABC transporter permease [Paenibacillus rigui]|uniref:Arabinose transporter permease n=1 Tax=Paenibacillus rigui TaxID=554312 RepID=A0A229UKC2_9BACL|nr:sugar ABC transporter permease [Paenibacillus rigui]OXM83821.1 arabinose transporter permease [Paenibacillus rigui]